MSAPSWPAAHPAAPPLPIAFDLPGWEDHEWHLRGDTLLFTWTHPDTTIGGDRKPVTVHTEASVRRAGSLDRAAWFCVRLAVLHAAAESLVIDGAQSAFHPHESHWWEGEYRAGPEALEPAA